MKFKTHYDNFQVSYRASDEVIRADWLLLFLLSLLGLAYSLWAWESPDRVPLLSGGFLVAMPLLAILFLHQLFRRG